MTATDNPTITALENAAAAQQLARAEAERLQHEIRQQARIVIDGARMTPATVKALEAIIRATWRTQEYLKELRTKE